MGKHANQIVQHSLFPELNIKFPSTRYQGSKQKILLWIWDQIKDIEFSTCLDAFSGTAVVGHYFKQMGKQVTCNDILRFNYNFASALVENSFVKLSDDETDWLFERHNDVDYQDFIQKNFQNIYFTDEENEWIDQTIANIYKLNQPYKFAIAFFALCQACIIKRPYNLFHRKNLYLRLADVDRSFGNKSTWDKPFDYWFRVFINEANGAIFDNGKKNMALNNDALTIEKKYDLIYIDTPYVSKNGIAVDYRHFYHFLEGLTFYYEWDKHIDRRYKHYCLKIIQNDWSDKNKIHNAFDKLFKHFRDSILIVSYRSDGIPSENELIDILKKYKSSVKVEHYGNYKYVLSKNSISQEILLIAS